LTQADDLRVDYVISGLGTGGAEMMLLKLLEHAPQLRKGRVIALNRGGPVADRLRGLGVRVVCLGIRPAVPNPVGFATLYRLLRQDRPDLVSTWMYHADLLGGLAARAAGIPAVWGIRNSTLGPQTRITTRAVVRLCAWLSNRVPTRIVSCSLRARQIHEALGYAASRFRVIPNGFDLARFRPDAQARASVRAELGIVDSSLVVGLVARFDPQKDHAAFVQAAGRVRAERPGVRFVLLGAGVDSGNASLTRWIRESGIDGEVSLLGPRTDVARLMAAFDVLVSSSRGEAFPNVLGEAMACAVPCVVTDVGDSAEIVGETGIVVPPGEPEALAGAMLRLLALPENERLALGERARQRVAARFSIQSTVAQYEQVFDEVVRAARQKATGSRMEDS